MHTLHFMFGVGAFIAPVIGENLLNWPSGPFAIILLKSCFSVFMLTEFFCIFIKRLFLCCFYSWSFWKIKSQFVECNFFKISAIRVRSVQMFRVYKNTNKQTEKSYIFRLNKQINIYDQRPSFQLNLFWAMLKKFWRMRTRLLLKTLLLL